MPIKTSDRILGPSRGSAERIIAYAREHGAARMDDTAAYITEAYRLAPLCGIDPFLVIAQSLQETFYAGNGQPWNSFWWQQRLNPAGIGITGDPAQDDASRIFATGTEAARAQVAHLLMYTVGKIDRGGLTKADDPRYDAYLEAHGSSPIAVTIADLAGTWAADTNYAEGIVSRGNAALTISDQMTGGKPPMANITFGNISHPDYIDSYVSSNENTAWNDLGQRTVRGIVYHRMLGSLDGTDQFFHGGAAALTDYGVGVAAQDGDHLDGVLYRWNDPQGRRAGWSNGALSAPYGDGLSFFNQYGINAINRDLTSIEISGFQTTPLSAKARLRIIELTAYWADRYHVSWETYPLIPEEGNRSFVVWHQEITIGTGKQCPFEVVMAETPSLIADVKAMLKSAQTSGNTPPPPKPKPPTPPKYPKPIVPAALHNDLVAGKGPNQHVVDGITYKASLTKWRATRSTRRMQQPIEVTSKVVAVGPSIKANTALTAWWETEKTLITRAGTSFYKNAFTPITHDVAKTLRATEAPVKEDA